MTKHNREPAKRTDTTEDLMQVVYALQRAESDNQQLADRLFKEGDYRAEMPAADAESIHKAIAIISKLAFGWVLVPAELTAENGMKAALIGEFREDYTITDDHGDTHRESVLVSWHNIKAIHKRVVEIAAAPKP